MIKMWNRDRLLHGGKCACGRGGHLDGDTGAHGDLVVGEELDEAGAVGVSARGNQAANIR